MSTEAEWKISVYNTLPGLKEGLRSGTKTKAEYDTALGELIAGGNDVTDAGAEYHRLSSLLQVNRHLV